MNVIIANYTDDTGDRRHFTISVADHLGWVKLDDMPLVNSERSDFPTREAALGWLGRVLEEPGNME